MKRLLAATAAILLAPLAALAGALPPPTPDRPGIVEVWGDPQMAGLVARWSQRFEAANPGVRIVAHLTGSDVGLAALGTGAADIALTGREGGEMEVKAFEWVHGHQPRAVLILRGSLDRPGRSPALAVLAHRRNPIARLSLAQLRRAFAVDASGAPLARSWGDLGAGGAWAARPIHLYMPDAESGSGRFFRHVVLGDANLLNWTALHEVSEPAADPTHADRLGAKIAAALARDPDGLAIGLLPGRQAPIKALALAPEPGGAFTPLTAAAVIDQTYPLARNAYAYVDAAPGKPPRPEVAAFLTYLLTPEAQSLRPADGYLPLPPAVRRQAIEALNAR